MTLANWIAVIVGTWVAGAALTAWSALEFGDLGRRRADIADALMIALGPITMTFMTTIFVAVWLGLVEVDRRPR